MKSSIKKRRIKVIIALERDLLTGMLRINGHRTDLELSPQAKQRITKELETLKARI